MYAYDPILLEKVKIDEWIASSPNNIIVIIEYNNEVNIKNFSQFTSKKNNIFALNKNYIQNVNVRDIFLKCIIINNQLLPYETYKSKTQFYNFGYFFNRKILINLNDIKLNKIKGQFFNLKLLNNEDDYINKEYLALSNIGLISKIKINIQNLNKLSISKQEKIKKEELRNKIIDRKNLPYKKEVYFEELLAKALTNYSYQWDAPINNYLRNGISYFETPIFKKFHLRYGNTIEKAKTAILDKILDLDRVFLEAAPRNENSKQIFWRGMKQNFDGINNIGDKVLVPNFISITKKYNIALSFSDILSYSKCCLYKIMIDRGIPCVDMVTTSKYKNEKEILLPRNLIFELINIENVKIKSFIGKNEIIEIMTIQVHMNNPSQFIIENNCKSYILGKLESIKPNSLFLKSFNKENNSLSNLESNVETKNNTSIKRCPKGTRKNKKTGLCESINQTSEVLNKKNKPLKTDKQPKCPKGTRRNKKTGLCESINQTSEVLNKKNKLLKTDKQPKCPKGTRRNKKTGLCESYL